VQSRTSGLTVLWGRLRTSDDDLLWIRGVLNSNTDFGKIVVHDHTPVNEPEVLPDGCLRAPLRVLPNCQMII
jgi:hypothetical protein